MNHPARAGSQILKPQCPPSFLEDIFIGYRILAQQFFPFSTWKMSCHFFLAYMVSVEIRYSHCFSSIGNVVFLFGYLQDFFFLCLSVQKFDYDVSFFRFILFRICSTSCIYRLMIFAKYGNFSGITSLNVFSAPLFSSPSRR